MSTARQYPEKKEHPAHEKIQQIADRLEALLHKTEKTTQFIMPQTEIDACAREVIDIINQYHASIYKFESYLKNAIIDLTEIPYMQPHVQKISFEISVRAALNNLQAFLTHTLML